MDFKKFFYDPYPQTPEQWGDANYTLYRAFKFISNPDLQILMRLVKENIPDEGNNRYRRARLLGILYSQFSQRTTIFYLQHYHPKTWWVRYQWDKTKKKYHRFFKTKKFKGEAYLCNLASEVIEENKIK